MSKKTPKSTDVDLPKIDLIDYFLSSIYIPIFLSTFFVFELLQRLTRPFGKNIYLKTVVLMNRAFCRCLSITGTKIEVTNPPKLDPEKSYIIISNHQSMYDMPILSETFHSHHPRFIAKKEMAKGLPAISYNLKHASHALIDRSDPKQALPEIKRFAEFIESERAAGIIFPEGTRSRRGQLKDFKKKGTLTLLEHAPNSEVIPVTIKNTWKLSARNSTLMPRNTEVAVCVGAAINRVGRSNEEILLEARRVIEENLKKARSSPKC